MDKVISIFNLIIQLHLCNSFSDCIWISTFTQGSVVSVRRYTLETKDLPQIPAYLLL